MPKLGPGWGRPLLSKKFHYFTADDPTTSICGRWGFFGGYREDEYDDHSENCAECKRKVKVLRAKAEEVK